MANSKISGLPLATTPLAGTEVLPIVQGGATKQVSVGNLTAGRAVSATEFIGPLTDSTYRRIYNPNGGTYIGFAVTNTGAIRVKFPIGVNAEFVNITLKVIENDSPNLTFEAHFGGYVNGPWIGNCFAYIVGSPNTNRQFTVRFGWDGSSRLFVYIGELSSSWVNAAISITEVQTGYGTASPIWTSGWEIDFVSSAFQNVTDTITAPQVGYLVASGNTAQGSVQYSGTTSTAGTFDGGTTTPTATNRLNYSGNFYPTALNLVGTGDTATAATHYIVETGSDGFLRPKTLANTQAEIVTNASVSAAISSGLSTLTVTGNTFLATTSGDVGIGTTSPAQKLDVQGATNPTIKVRNITPGVGNYSQLYLDTNNTFSGAGAAYLRAISENAGNSAVSLALGVNANGGGAPSEAMRITAAGDVGIGTSSPGDKLTIAAGRIRLDQDYQIVWQNAGTNRARIYGDSGNSLIFENGSSNTERMRITSAGDVGVGTSSPSGKFGVNNPGTGQVGFNGGTVSSPNRGNLFYDTDGTGWDFRIGKLQAGVFTPQLTIKDSGDVGIGTSSPAAKLEVYGGDVRSTLPGASATTLRGLSIASDSTEFSSLKAESSTGETRLTSGFAGFGGYSTFHTNGSERMRLDASGNLGIGTSSPGAKLDVVGSLGVRINEDGAGTNVLSFRSNFAGLGPAINVTTTDPLLLLTANTERMRITATGDVGIGTSSPAAKLHVYGSGTTQAVLTSADQTTTYLRFINTTHNGGYVGYTSDNLIFLTGAAEKMRLDASGNLGIGTSGPAFRLTANYTAPATFTNAASDFLQMWQASGANALGFAANTTGTVARLVLNNSYNFAVNYASSELVRITSAGDVGIGTTSPDAKLRVNGTAKVGDGAATNTSKLMVNTVSGVAAGIQLFQDANESWIIQNPASTTALTFGNSGSERMRITGTGDVGIGTSSPGAKLHVAGQTRIQDSANAANYILIGSGANAPRGGNSVMAQTSSMVMGTEGTAPLIFITNAAEGMRIDSSGNLGLGVTPSAWSASGLIDFSGNGVVGGSASGLSTNAFWAGCNWYYGSGAYRYKATNSAGMYQIGGTEHRWFTAPSGTAGNAITFTQAMTLDASGNLLVGTTSNADSRRLRVYGISEFDGNSVGLTIYKSSGTKIGSSGQGDYVVSGGPSDGFGIQSQTALVFGSGGTTERARIDSSGNLGLGVTPSAWATLKGFDISTGGALFGYSAQVGLANNAYFNGSTWRYKNTDAATFFRANAPGFEWHVAPSGTAGNAISFTQAMTLDASGNLLVGMTSALKTANFKGTGLALVGSSQNTGNELFFYRADNLMMGYIGWETPGNANSPFLFDSTNGNPIAWSINNTERARITSGGDLLVGKTTASGTTVGPELLANGQINTATANLDNLNIYNTTAAAYRFYVNAAGTVFATNTTISAISDQRLKENVQDLDAGLDKIMALKPRKFDWKAGKGKNIKGDRGFIAQEFEQVFPDLIDEWKDPVSEGEEPYKSVRQDLIPVLVKAIQELKAEVDSLKTQLGA